MVHLLKNKLINNAKINEIEGKMPSVTGLATDAVFNIIENKIPTLVIQSKKKTDYEARISDIETKYFTTPGYKSFTNETRNAR